VIRTVIVEDDVHVASVHRGYLERLGGFEVAGEARTAKDAIDLIERLHVDLVLLDVYLPDMSGLDVLRRIRASGRGHVDVIAITAARDVDTLRSALQGGAVHYLVKPFHFAVFREKLESYAAARARLASARELDQAEVDRVVGLLRPEGRSTLPKGLSTATLDLVARALRGEHVDLSAVDVAKRTGLSRVTSRRYLDHLVRSGTVELTMRYGSAGRPEHRYRWLAREEAVPART
jgi:two-component system CitB family response regulator